jgi:transcriptional regulator of acetoin/glycerol metabolism
MDDDESLITESHLPEELFETPIPPRMQEAASMAINTSGNGSLEEIGRQAAQNALEVAGGNISAAARLLGVSRNTLYRKLGRLG